MAENDLRGFELAYADELAAGGESPKVRLNGRVLLLLPMSSPIFVNASTSLHHDRVAKDAEIIKRPSHAVLVRIFSTKPRVMDGPFLIANSTAELLSRGLHSIEYLYHFYTNCHYQHHDLARTVDRLGDLLHTLRTINETVRIPQPQLQQGTAVQTIERSIACCDGVIHELDDEVQKFRGLATNVSSETTGSVGRRLAYPIRESTLKKVDEDITEFQSNVSMLLQSYQVQKCHDPQADKEGGSHIAHIERQVISPRSSQNGTINIDGYARVHIGDTIIQNDVEEVEQLLKYLQARTSRAGLREWLRAPDATVNLNNACAKRHEGTGQWLVQGPKFITWLQQSNAFLWLYGFAGCGKSVLCTTAIQHAFHRKQCSPNNSAAAFFFFTFNDESKQNASAALRALLLQLCGQIPGLEDDLAQLKDLYNQGTPPVPTLLEYLRRAVSRCRHVYILLDALDESPVGNTRNEVLSMITKMRQWQLPNLHLLVTSRDVPDIRDNLESLTSCLGGDHVALKKDGIQQDIARYVAFQVDHDRRLQRWNESQREMIKMHLTQHAAGVFRWVECQLRPLRLCAHSEKHLERCLHTLPRSLDETYERMLCEIESREEARKMLSLLCHASRPLSVNEVVEALAVDTEVLECYDLRSRFTGGVEDLLCLCPGLIEVNYSNSIEVGIVRIAHFSVQEYLLSNRIKESRAYEFALCSPLQHGWISKVCMLYLSHDDFLQRDLTEALMEQYSFAEYAAEHWFYHYLEANSIFPHQLTASVAAWLNNRDTLKRWTDINDPAQPWWRMMSYGMSFSTSCPSPTYYASILGLDGVLANLLSISTADVNVEEGEDGTALHAASRRGHEKVVQILLDNGAKVAPWDDKCRTALRLASESGHEKVVQILLDNGADIDNVGKGYGTKLLAASERGREKVVQVLLDISANIDNIEYGYNSIALWLASERGHEKVVQVLLDKGQNINLLDEEYRTALWAASESGHEKVVQLLLDSGADVNARAQNQSTPLQAALRGGHEKVVKILLRYGAR